MAKSRKIPPAQVQRGKKRVEVVQDDHGDDNDDDEDNDDDRMELSEKEQDKENQRPHRSVSTTKKTNQGASVGELEKEIIKVRLTAPTHHPRPFLSPRHAPNDSSEPN
jgi:hypothetical protein